MSREEELRAELSRIESDRLAQYWGKCLNCKHHNPHELQTAYQCDKHRVSGGDAYYTKFEPTCSEWPSIKKMESKFLERNSN